MAAKTQERFGVVCEGLWLNDTKPSDWNQQFPWKPNVSFYYYHLDAHWQAVGEVQKCWIKGEKNLWLYQAMGGDQAKGRYFEVEAEHGVMKQQGKADKPYTTITPMGELFRDGTDRMLRPPVDNKVSVPPTAAKTPPPAAVPPPGAVQPPPGPKPATPPPPGPKPGTPAPETAQTPPPEKKPPAPRPKPSEAFMNSCFIPESSQFWLMKDGFAEDGFILNQAHELAVQMALSRIGWKNQKVFLQMQDTAPATGPGIGELPVTPLAFADQAAYQVEYQEWVDFFERDLSERRWKKVSQRFEALLANCTQPDQVYSLVNRAWAHLPLHHYEPLRTRARDVLAALKPDQQQPPPWVGSMTATPGVWFDEGGEVIRKTKAVTPTPQTAPPPAPEPPPGPDPKVVAFTLASVPKLKEWPKLRAFWTSTVPDIQRLPEVVKEFQGAILNIFMGAKYQADVDAILNDGDLRIPPGLATEDFMVILQRRYGELAEF